MTLEEIIAEVHREVDAEREAKKLPKWDWSAPKKSLKPQSWRAIWRNGRRIKLRAMAAKAGK